MVLQLVLKNAQIEAIVQKSNILLWRWLLGRGHARARSTIHARGCTRRRRHARSWRALHPWGHAKPGRTPRAAHAGGRAAHHLRRTHGPLSIRPWHAWSRHLRGRTRRRWHWPSARRTLSIALRRSLPRGSLTPCIIWPGGHMPGGGAPGVQASDGVRIAQGEVDLGDALPESDQEEACT